MLAWSTAGAVERPQSLQIRVQRSYPGRIRAGAPSPSRGMSFEELKANVLHFTEGYAAHPRERPIRSLVLSGVGVATREDIPQLIALARQNTVDWVTLHVGVEDLEGVALGHLAELVDQLVLPVAPRSGTLAQMAELVKRSRDLGVRLVTNTVLNNRSLEGLPAAARMLAGAGPDQCAFTFPFPINGSDSTHAPPVSRAVSALEVPLKQLESAGVPVVIKGLPACLLGPLGHLAGRSINRWYVDADHQLGEALLFFPAVVAFDKEDVCRFCDQNADCDGFFATYLNRPGCPPLGFPLD